MSLLNFSQCPTVLMLFVVVEANIVTLGVTCLFLQTCTLALLREHGCPMQVFISTDIWQKDETLSVLHSLSMQCHTF